jgi:hypothetical protein
MRTAASAVLAAAALALFPQLACAHPRESPARAGPWTLELLDASGAALPTYYHRGRAWVLGTLGERYVVRVRNGSDRRAEVVVSVDGRDVVDGKPARPEKRGYLVPPHGEVVIDGFRLSGAAVAAFRFSSVKGSYAARMGDARDVGVVGVAVFPERAPAVAALRDRASPPHRGDASAPEAAPAPSADAGATAPPRAAGEGAERHAGARRPAEERPGLGTEFGEEHASPVVEVPFERESARPAAVLAVRYDDRAGLRALGIDLEPWRTARRDEARLRESAEPFRGSGFAAPPPGWRGR